MSQQPKIAQLIKRYSEQVRSPDSPQFVEGADRLVELCNQMRELESVAEEALLHAVHLMHESGYFEYDVLLKVWECLGQTRNPATVQAILKCEDVSECWAQALRRISWDNPSLAPLRLQAIEMLVHAMLMVEFDQDTAEAAAKALLNLEPVAVAQNLIDVVGNRTATGSALRGVASDTGNEFVINSLAHVLFDLPPEMVISQDYLVQCVLEELEMIDQPQFCQTMFMPMLESTFPALRAFAAHALAMVVSPDALPALIRHQNDTDRRVQESVGEAIARIQAFREATPEPQAESSSARRRRQPRVEG